MSQQRNGPGDPPELRVARLTVSQTRLPRSSSVVRTCSQTLRNALVWRAVTRSATSMCVAERVSLPGQRPTFRKAPLSRRASEFRAISVPSLRLPPGVQRQIVNDFRKKVCEWPPPDAPRTCEDPCGLGASSHSTIRPPWRATFACKKAFPMFPEIIISLATNHRQRGTNTGRGRRPLLPSNPPMV